MYDGNFWIKSNHDAFFTANVTETYGTFTLIVKQYNINNQQINEYQGTTSGSYVQIWLPKTTNATYITATLTVNAPLKLTGYSFSQNPY